MVLIYFSRPLYTKSVYYLFLVKLISYVYIFNIQFYLKITTIDEN